MSFCIRCGSSLDEGVERCPYCGAQQPEAKPVQSGSLQDLLNPTPEPAPEPSEPQKQRRKQGIILAAIACVVVVAIVAVILINNANKGSGSTTPGAPDGGAAAVSADASSISAEDAAKAEEQRKAEEAKRKEEEQKKKEEEEAQKKAAAMKAIADAYNEALDTTDATLFGFDLSLKCTYTYFLAELTGDDIPELVISASSNPSDEYYRFFVYEDGAGAVAVGEPTRNYHLRESWGITADGHALAMAGTYGGQVVFNRLHIVGEELLLDSTDETYGSGSTEVGELPVHDISDRSAIDGLVNGAGQVTQTTQATASPQAEAQDEHARLREEAEAKGMQVITGFYHVTTEGARAREVGGESLAKNFTSSADNLMAVIDFDGTQSITGNSGDGMGTTTQDIGSLRADNGDGFDLSDGDHVCVGVYPQDLWYESSVRYELAPAHAPITLLYKD